MRKKMHRSERETRSNLPLFRQLTGRPWSMKQGKAQGRKEDDDDDDDCLALRTRQRNGGVLKAG